MILIIRKIDNISICITKIDVKLAPRKNELYKNEFPSIKISSMDSEFNSALNELNSMNGNSFRREKFAPGHHTWTRIYV